MSTDLEVAAARREGELIARLWMLRHASEYDQTPENAKKIENWLAENNLPFNEENLEIAFKALTAQGVRFVSKPSEPTINDIAPVPAYFPKLETLADFQRLNAEDTRRLSTGPDREKYEARLRVVQQPGYTPKSAAPATQPGTLDKYGLPEVPGVSPEFLPNNYDEIEKMGKNYGLLLRSKKAGVGKAFEARVKAILKREGR